MMNLASPMVSALLSLTLVTPGVSVAQPTEEITANEIFDFDFRSGMYSIDLNNDGVADVLSIGYMSAGTGTTQFDFNFLIARPPHFLNITQQYHTVVPDEASRNRFRTLANADCVLRSLYLVKLGADQDDWKLLIVERTSVPEGGYTESPVELRLLRLREATSAGAAVFSYRQVAETTTTDSYCNVGDAIALEWPLLSGQFAQSIDND